MFCFCIAFSSFVPNWRHGFHECVVIFSKEKKRQIETEFKKRVPSHSSYIRPDRVEVFRGALMGFLWIMVLWFGYFPMATKMDVAIHDDEQNAALSSSFGAN